ncbi:putative Phi92_gp137 [Vibrio phage 249E41-1]|nr:putative Phi92_gp137 [Vibrio phage 249E41-1]CAH9012872.1 putative Phi92_gp137 [Vibrio phage 495E54-1]CAH9013074.1 putative Phi92_gp137 [Vibrio phage 496E54-1]CAH9016752.1 putative Phi92_gp137 [Vibrio phage 193E37-1]
MARSTILYRMVIGDPLKVADGFEVPLKNEKFPTIALGDYYDKGAKPNAYEFTKHQIVFNCRLSSTTSNANSAKITLYNLDDNVVSYLEANNNNNLVCVLEAGDNEQGLGQIFAGTLVNVLDNFSGNDRRTQLTVTDGGFNIKNAFTVRSYPRNTEYSTIIQELNRDMRLPFSTFGAIKGRTLTPLSFYGKTHGILTTELPKLGFNYSIQKGSISLIPETKRVEKEVSFISKETGLIGKVVLDNSDDKSVAGQASQKSSGISFTCLLDSALAPDETVYVRDGQYDGAYKIVSVNFDGNYEGNSWVSTVQAVETDGVVSI